MSDRTLLILKISGFIAITALLIWVVWAVFFRLPGESLVPGSDVIPGSQERLPPINEGQGGSVVGDEGPTTLVPEESIPQTQTQPDTVAAGGRTTVESIVPERAAFNTITAGGFHYYSISDERFYRISQNGGELIQLSPDLFPQVQNVSWAGSGNAAILEFPDGSNIYYNFTTGVRATLPKEAREFSFAPDEKNIAYEYIGQSVDDRYIVTSDVTGQGQRVIEPIGRESLNVSINWSPNSQVVATFRKPTNGTGEEVFFIGQNGENFLSLETGGLGFEGAWSPEGKQMLYSVYSEGTNYNPVLHIAGAEGDSIGLNNRSLRLQTWPDKCVFQSESLLYCAVPLNLEQGSGIYPELSASTVDSIYKIDLTNNSQTLIAFPESESQSSFLITKMMLSEDGRELFFTDLTNGQIHQLRLP